MIRIEHNLSFPYISDDPVRPELSMTFRTQDGREVYALYNEDNTIKSIICVEIGRAHV